MASSSDADEAQSCIDRGLARYGRGEFYLAMVEFEKAIALDPDNAEAHKLLEFVRDSMPRTEHEGGAAAGSEDDRTTEPVLKAFDSGSWSTGEDTDPESVGQTAERVRRSEQEVKDLGEPRKRRTAESPIPELLAKITSPTWQPPPEREREQGAPLAPMSERETPTRRLGSDTPYTGSGLVPDLRDAPADDLARDARVRASNLVDECRNHLQEGNWDQAAAAADLALREAEKAPPPGIAEVVEPARPLFTKAFETFLAPEHSVPVVSMAPGKLELLQLDHRAGFLVSQIDGVMTVEHLLDIAGMPRFEALRLLSGLARSKVVKLL